MISYLVLRAETPEVFGEFHPLAAEDALSQHLTMILPHRDNDGRRIMYSRIGQAFQQFTRGTQLTFVFRNG